MEAISFSAGAEYPPPAFVVAVRYYSVSMAVPHSAQPLESSKGISRYMYVDGVNSTGPRN